MLVLLYGYENKDFFHGHINTQTIFKFPDKLIGRRAPTTVPPRTSAIQQQSCSSQEIQRIASLHLAETFEADSAAPWQRAPPLDHVQVAAVRAAWHES